MAYEYAKRGGQMYFRFHLGNDNDAPLAEDHKKYLDRHVEYFLHELPVCYVNKNFAFDLCVEKALMAARLMNKWQGQMKGDAIVEKRDES